MRKLKILMLSILGFMPLKMFAWPGMPTPVLHVEGKYLKDPCGNTVLLHGVAITISPWFNGCMYGSSYCRWNNYDVQGCLNYNKAVMDRLTNTVDGWYLNYIRLHIDPYWTNNRGASVPENDISQFNMTNFQNCVNQVIIPLIEHAKSRGMYVILRPPGVCPDRIALNDAYYNYLVTVWSYLSQHMGLKNRDNVMFELANEPVNIRASDGTYGQDAQKYYDALKSFFQPIVNLIRNNGANNVIWIPGLGYQSLYRGLANNRISGSNIGFAVHVYPGYWGMDLNNTTNFNNGWNTHIKPVADIAPIVITETDWGPSQYNVWGKGGTTSGFGTNLKNIAAASGNVSWNLLSPDNLIDHGDPNGNTAYNNDWEACGRPSKQWFQEYSCCNLPASGCSSSGNITVRARGTQGTEQIQINLNGSVAGTFTLTTSYVNYSVSGSGTLRVQFINDASGRDVQVDYAVINGTTYQAENQTVNTGVWNGSSCGGSKSEWLHCNGYIEFGTGSSAGLINNGIYTIEFQTDPSKVLDLRYGEDVNGGILRPWSKNGATAQEWIAIDAGNNYWRFISNASASNRCIDLANGSTSNGTSIRLWDNYNNDAQAWLVTSAGNGYYKIVSKLNTSRSWDIPNCNMDGNNNLQLWDYYGTSCQLFKFNYIRTKSTHGTSQEIVNEDMTSSFEIYPNPAVNGYFTVSVHGLENLNIVIYNINGKKVYEQNKLNIGDNIINTGLSKGLYFVKAYSNEYNLTKKVVIQ
jgi:hypothetical protein